MKGSGEGAAYVTMNFGGAPSSEQGQSTSTTGARKKPHVKTKDNLWCNYCTRRCHTKETCWKFPQVHTVNSPYSPQEGQLENKIDGQRWAPTHAPQNYSITPSPLSNHPMKQLPSFPLQGPHHDVPRK